LNANKERKSEHTSS